MSGLRSEAATGPNLIHGRWVEGGPLSQQAGDGMSGKRDYYEVLGLDRDADEKALKNAFRRLARKYHPDRSDEPDAEDRFKEIQEAYAVLSDPRNAANTTDSDMTGPEEVSVVDSTSISAICLAVQTSSQPSLAVGGAVSVRGVAATSCTAIPYRVKT